jgi:hypothetical protein
MRGNEIHLLQRTKYFVLLTRYWERRYHSIVALYKVAILSDR